MEPSGGRPVFSGFSFLHPAAQGTVIAHSHTAVLTLYGGGRPVFSGVSFLHPAAQGTVTAHSHTAVLTIPRLLRYFNHQRLHEILS